MLVEEPKLRAYDLFVKFLNFFVVEKFEYNRK